MPGRDATGTPARRERLPCNKENSPQKNTKNAMISFNITMGGPGLVVGLVIHRSRSRSRTRTRRPLREPNFHARSSASALPRFAPATPCLCAPLRSNPCNISAMPDIFLLEPGLLYAGNRVCPLKQYIFYPL